MTERPPVHLPTGVAEPAGLVDAVLGYEAALMADDVAALDAWFAPGPDTLRGDAAGLLVGSAAIAAFRRGRGGAPARRLVRLEVRPVGQDAALVVAVLAPAAGGTGQQTQLWRRGPDGWRVEVAHVSGPVPAVDARVWRLVGTPLVAGAQHGPLRGRRVAVKDVIAVAGVPVGGGNPAFLAAQPPASRTAPAVEALLAAGADVVGIARTDELAYSIAGRNAHHGTPPNGAVPGALPGGSSSGPASAVALGQADVGLGTDTAGSLRVPASYQGLWALRTTHGRVPTDGVLPLAPTFDTVGWLTRDLPTLRAAAVASLGAGEPAWRPARYLVAPRHLAALDAPVRHAFEAAVAHFARTEVDLGDPAELFEVFRVVQAAQAWRAHGDFVRAHPDALGPGVAERFAAAAAVTAAQEQAALAALAEHRARLDAVLGDDVLLLPSASGAAPSATADEAELDRARTATLRLCCVAGLTGRPAVGIPVLAAPGPNGADAPLGLCLVGPRGADLGLLDVARDVSSLVAGATRS